MTNQHNALAVYVRNMPQPGSGNCNRHLLGAATIGVSSGLSDSEIFHTILSGLVKPGGNTPHAIRRAIMRARRGTIGGHKNSYVKQHQSPQRHTAYRDFLTRSPISIEHCITQSPVRLVRNEIINAKNMLDTLWSRDEVLFIGDVFGSSIKTAKQWRDTASAWNVHIIPNPLDGEEHETQIGTMSRRCDASVVEWRYCVCEFDDLEVEKQVALWLNIDLPVAALIYSGGKSIHAWIKVSSPKSNDWDAIRSFYVESLIPLGIDPACKNPSRLSRMPGVMRTDKNSVQRIIFLNPDAK